MLNNAIRAIIVYGSQAPGGSAHMPFADLPGEWQPGTIRVDPHRLPDDIGPGETSEIPAWYLEFSDVGRYEVGDPDQLAKAVLMYERWESLDKAVGSDFVRSSKRWWPKGVETVPNKQMRVANIYVPRKRFPYLANQEKAPHPNKANDIFALWREVVDETARYDSSEFIALIKDAHPDDYADLFGNLPHGAAFVARLRSVFRDLALSPDSMLWDGKSDSFHFYAHPPTRHAVAPDALVKMAKDAVAAHLALLPGDQADALRRVTFQLGTREDARSADDTGAFDAWEEADDISREQQPGGGAWAYCLSEACYGIAASYEVVRYLMGALDDSPFDPVPGYRFWRAGGRYEIGGDTCFVWSEPLRETSFILPSEQKEPTPPKSGWRKWFGG